MFKENKIEQVKKEHQLGIGVENWKTATVISFTGKEINDYLDLETTGDLSRSKFKAKMITFLVGLFLAFGAMGTTAQAQNWRRIATRGVESAVVTAEQKKTNQILEEFQQEATRIDLLEEELNQKFRQESDELFTKKDEAGLEKLEKAYAIEKNKLAMAREKNRQEYKSKMEKQRIRRQAVDLIRDVIR